MCFSHCMNPALATATLGVGEMSSTHPQHCTQRYSGVGRGMTGPGKTSQGLELAVEIRNGTLNLNLQLCQFTDDKEN